MNDPFLLRVLGYMHRPVTIETVVPARILKSGEGRKQELEASSGQVATGLPSRAVIPFTP